MFLEAEVDNKNERTGNTHRHQNKRTNQNTEQRTPNTEKKERGEGNNRRREEGSPSVLCLSFFSSRLSALFVLPLSSSSLPLSSFCSPPTFHSPMPSPSPPRHTLRMGTSPYNERRRAKLTPCCPLIICTLFPLSFFFF